MIYIIVNPVSGAGRANKAIPLIDRLIRESGREYTFLYTESADDFQRISGLIDRETAEAVVCVGGDGTIQQYFGLAVGLDLPFGVIPVGSGNDFLYSLPEGERKFSSFEDKITYYTQKILAGATIQIDAVSVNGDDYFLNIGGLGIDIQVLKDALPLKKLFGGSAYFLSLLKNTLTYKAEEMTLTVDGKTETDRFLLVSVCNGSYYGGHLRVAPTAVIDDGLLTLCIVRNMPRLKLMMLFPLVKPGKHARIKEVSFVNCSVARLDFKGRKTINFDGNLPEFESPLTFNVMKGAVRFIV